MKPFIVTITGPSRAGKTTLADQLVKEHDFVRLVTTTTRPSRVGEKIGVDYHFTTHEQFSKRHFLESVDVGVHRYGLSLDEINDKSRKHNALVVVVTPSGRDAIRKLCEERGWTHFAIFLTNPDHVIAERFLYRAYSGMKADFSAVNGLTQRMKQMMTVERGWLAEAFLQVDPARADGTYQMCIWEYDSDSPIDYAHFINVEFTKSFLALS